MSTKSVHIESIDFLPSMPHTGYMNKELAGDIQHEVAPVIGWLRLALADGKPLTTGQMGAAVEKLMRALDAAKHIEENV